MANQLPVCKYGASCYRKNPEHLKQFSHPRKRMVETLSADKDTVTPHTKRRHTRDNTTEVKVSEPSITSFFHPTESSSRGKKENTTDECSSQSSPPAKKRRPVNGKQDEEQEQQEKRYVDDDELLKESDNDRENVKRKFLVDMPEDFYLFWEFCKTLEPLNPQHALKPILGLELTGPYDVLGGRLKGVPWERCVLHSRYYYDPPELVTVLHQCTDSGDQTGYHIGYFRDDPKGTDSLVVSNSSKDGCELRIEGESLFSVVRLMIAKKLEDKSLKADHKKDLEKINIDILSKMSHCKGVGVKDLIKQRNKVMLSSCFHKMGLVVPYDETTDLGYRPLPISDKELWKLLNKISNSSQDTKKQDLAFEPLQEVITLVQFANDECDYGMGLELGLNLFCHGDQYFHTVIEQLLPLAYDLLQREEYSKICQAHLQNRAVEPLDFRTRLT